MASLNDLKDSSSSGQALPTRTLATRSNLPDQAYDLVALRNDLKNSSKDDQEFAVKCANTFFPTRLIDLAKRLAVEEDQLKEEQAHSWIDENVEILVDSGPTYPTMPLRVKVSDLLTKEVHASLDGLAKIDMRTVPMIALSDSETAERLRARCIAYADKAATIDQYSGELKTGETSLIRWEAHKAVVKYYRSTEDPLVKEALRSYVMQYFEIVHLRYILNSQHKTGGLLSVLTQSNRREPLPFEAIKQIRRQMAKLRFESIVDIILQLSKELKSNREASGNNLFSTRKLQEEIHQASWTRCFCVILVLCECAERAQVATDMMVNYLVGVYGAEPKDTKDIGVKHCEQLRNLCLDIVSRLAAKGRDAESDKASTTLIDKIRQLAAKNENEMIAGSQDESLYYEIKPGDLSGYKKFREQNSGSLVAHLIRIVIEGKGKKDKGKGEGCG